MGREKNTTKRTISIESQGNGRTIQANRNKISFITPSDQALRRLHGVTKQIRIRISKLNQSQTASNTWPCPEPDCSYKANFRPNLIVHMRMHTGAKPYACQLCPSKFRQTPHLKRHVTIHHPTCKNSQRVPLEFICEICQFPSSSRGNLKIHMLKHSERRPFKCPFCDHATKHKSSLNVHLRTHTKEKPYKCNLCSYTCTQSTHLIRHIQTHTKETPISCAEPGCNYATSTQRQMKMHLFHAHGCGVREKKYKCELCPGFKAFYTKPHLNHHVLLHTGPRPHQCQWCPKTFVRSWVKVTHEKICGNRPS